MGTHDVRIDPKLNKAVWSKGVRYVHERMLQHAGLFSCVLFCVLCCSNVPNRIRVRVERKRNEDEDATNKLYSLVTYVPCGDFKGTLTTNVDLTEQ